MKFLFEDFKIITDSREQRPWKFVNEVVIRGLKTGDYSIEGYENCIAIERKSLDDFVSSVTYNRKRFKAELERARKIKHFIIIVEAAWFDAFTGNYHSAAIPNSIVGSAIGIMAEFGIPVIFAETRKQAERLCQKFLRLSLLREYEVIKE